MASVNLSNNSTPQAPVVQVFPNNWARQAGMAIQATIEAVIRMKGECSLMLTGGNSVQNIYRYWASLYNFPHEGIIYFFGDERRVPLNHHDSNYGTACLSLFPCGIPEHVKIHPMDVDNIDCFAGSMSYAQLLPSCIDVLLLGMGEDGHVASIFPGDTVATEFHSLVMPVRGPKPPEDRLTITPKVIADAETVFLLATGTQKGKVLSRVISEEGSVLELPVRCAKSATWLLDDLAGKELIKDSR
jgi:6-phosphogluconolactonase